MSTLVDEKTYTVVPVQFNKTIPVPVRQETIEQSNQEPENSSQKFFSDLPEHERKIVRKLLLLGFTPEEIQHSLRHPSFLKRCAVILGPGFFAVPLKRKREVIRRLILKIDAISEEESKEAGQSPPKKKHKRKRKLQQANNGTLRRLSMLVAMWDGAGILIQELVKLTGVSERRLRDALRSFERAGLIEKTKKGRSYYYFLTHQGVIFLGDKLKRTFRQGQLPMPFGNTLSRNVRDTLLELLKQAQKINKELTSLGWWHRCIRDLFFQHKLEYILSWIERVKANPNVEHPGAYLWAVLMTTIPNQERREAMAARILVTAGVDKKLTDTYLEESGQGMTARQALRFALAIRSFHRKCQKRGWAFTIGDVRGIANWCRYKVPA